MLKYLNVFSALIVCVSLINNSHTITIHQKSITNTTEPPVVAKSVNGFIISTGIDIAPDGLTKRDAPVDKFSASERFGGKSYEPLPEYYRGSSSNPPHVTTSSYTNRSEKSTFTFPQDNGSKRFGQDGGSSLKLEEEEEEEERKLRSTVSSITNSGRKSLRDRENVGVGHHHNVDHAGDNLQGSSNDYEVYEKHPYVTASGADGRSYSSEYDSGDVGRYASSYHSNNAEVIPFGLYGHNNGYKKVQHYDGSGSEYSYNHYPLEEHSYEHAIPKSYHHYSGGGYNHHPSNYDYSKKALFAKSFLIPLAGAAILGIAAALVTNPLFIQLGTVSGAATSALVGKRKRRAAEHKHKIGHVGDEGNKSGDYDITEEQSQIQEQQNHIEEKLNGIKRQPKQTQRTQEYQDQKKLSSRHNRLEVNKLLHPYRGYHHW